MPWTTLTGAADTLADSHATLAIKIESDVEQPLRNFVTTNREMSQISTVQGNIGSLAKDVQKAQEKTDKLAGKGERAETGKVATANSELDTAQQQWETQAPYVFESLQALDEARLNHLRDALTQFQTHEIDQVERDKSTAEQSLNVLLGVETGDEIRSFAQRAPQMKPTLRPKRNSIATPSRGLAPPPSNASASALTPTLSQENEDLYGTPSAGPSEEKAKGRLKGLRRLGTVMGRKRESKIPPGALPSTSESPERKQRPSPFNSLSGRLGRSRENAPTLSSLQETSPSQRPSEPMRLGSEIFQRQPSESRSPEITTPIPDSNLSESQPQQNGMSGGMVAAAAAGGTAAAAVPATLAILNGSHQNDLAGLETPKASEPQAQSQPQPAAAESQKDSEGYSVPPQELDPITQAQQEAAMLGDGSQPQYNVNIRDAPIQEEGAGGAVSLTDAATRLVCPQPDNCFVLYSQSTASAADYESPSWHCSRPT